MAVNSKYKGPELPFGSADVSEPVDCRPAPDKLCFLRIDENLGLVAHWVRLAVLKVVGLKQWPRDNVVEILENRVRDVRSKIDNCFPGLNVIDSEESSSLLITGEPDSPLFEQTRDRDTEFELRVRERSHHLGLVENILQIVHRINQIPGLMHGRNKLCFREKSAGKYVFSYRGVEIPWKHTDGSLRLNNLRDFILFIGEIDEEKMDF